VLPVQALLSSICRTQCICCVAGTRLVALLSGPPSCGRGSVTRRRHSRQQHHNTAPQSQRAAEGSMVDYLDPAYPEVSAYNNRQHTASPGRQHQTAQEAEVSLQIPYTDRVSPASAATRWQHMPTPPMTCVCRQLVSHIPLVSMADSMHGVCTLLGRFRQLLQVQPKHRVLSSCYRVCMSGHCALFVLC
jgi:hypothetical protein